ncbi:MAG TPA: ATP-binding protein [Spirochaetota bacterium]|nr:ATP-binding protein [Spirochaetota bacterium]HOL57364.1 ATP-binding protein [Spirochaetota bacterium]
MKNRYKIKIKFKLLFLTLCFSLIPAFLLIYFTQKNIYDYLITNARDFNFKSLQNSTNNLNFIIEKIKKEIEEIKNSDRYKEIDNFNLKDKIGEIISYDNLNRKFKEYLLTKDIEDLIVIDFNKISLLKNNYLINIYSQNQYIVRIENLMLEDFFIDIKNRDENNGYILATLKKDSIIGYNLEKRLFLINFIKDNNGIKKLFILALPDNLVTESLNIKDLNYAKLIIVDKYNGVIDIKNFIKDQVFETIYKKISESFYTKDDIFEIPQIKRLILILNKKIKNNEIINDNYYSIIKYEKEKFIVILYYNWEQELIYYSIQPLKIVFSSVTKTITGIIFIALIIFITILIASVISTNIIATPIETRTELIQDENVYFMNIAHELKTPLTVISNYLDKYLKEYGSNKDIEIIKNNIESLKKDMIDFLDFGKIERGQPFYNHNQTINFSEILKNKIVLFTVSANQKNIAINKNIEENIYIKIDPFAVDRILNNLFDNAIKYNKENGIIDVNLEVKNNKVFFTISDTGIGISEKKMKNLFNPFTQVLDGSKNSGVGLGLFIIKKIIDDIKGEIKVESRLNKGTKFTIILPLAKKEILTIKENSNEIIEKNNTILIVEDNEDLLNYLYISLKDYFNIEKAKNGLEAINKLNNIKPDLIISDIMMPELNGFEFFERVNSQENYRDIPFIFLSAISATEYKIRGFESGAVDYIVKPFKIEELFAKINSLLKFKKLKDILYKKDKYATIGMLVAGISHEILNPLAGIYAPVENIQKIVRNINFEQKMKIESFINDIWTNVKRIDSIIKNLKILFYNDRSTLEKKEIKIEDVVNSVLELFHNKIKDRITIIKKIEQGITVEANYASLTQIFLNLISNAIDAIKENGIITIESFKNNEGVIINIMDNGSGIPEKDLKNIFMPFWTSKEIGKGTGMGLYIVKDLIMRLNWKIEVSSIIGEGTKFTIYTKNV